MLTKTEPAPYEVAIPDPEEIIERANRVSEQIRPYARGNHEERVIHSDVIGLMQDAGLFRVLRPRRWGGYEMHPAVAAEVQFALAKADHSVGWVFGVLSVHAFQMALFPDQACADVYGAKDDALICSSFMPGGNAVPVPGGNKFNGKWRFASGSEHSEWCFLGGHRDGDFITCLLHKDEYELVDNWFTPGLRATKSQEMIVRDVVIPEHRIHSAADGFRCDSPGNAVNTSWLYRIPFHQVFLRGITNASLGGLEGMIEEFIEYSKARVSVVAGAAVEDPSVRCALGEATLTVHQLKAEMKANYDALIDYAKRGEVPPIELRLLSKLGASAVADRCREAAQKLFECTGGHGLYEESTEFARRYIDIISAKQHAASQNHLVAQSLGSLLLGVDSHQTLL